MGVSDPLLQRDVARTWSTSRGAPGLLLGHLLERFPVALLHAQ
jgi:hypothetical protein